MNPERPLPAELVDQLADRVYVDPGVLGHALAPGEKFPPVPDAFLPTGVAILRSRMGGSAPWPSDLGRLLDGYHAWLEGRGYRLLMPDRDHTTETPPSAVPTPAPSGEGCPGPPSAPFPLSGWACSRERDHRGPCHLRPPGSG